MARLSRVVAMAGWLGSSTRPRPARTRSNSAIASTARDLREARAPGSPEELAAFETDVMARFVLARAAAGLRGGPPSRCRRDRRGQRRRDFARDVEESEQRLHFGHQPLHVGRVSDGRPG